MKNKALLILLSFIILISLVSCKDKINPNDFSISKMSYYMYLDTVSQVTVEYNIYEKSTSEVEKELNYVSELLLEIEKEFSIEQTLYMKQAGITESTLMKVNSSSGVSSVTVSDMFLEVLLNAKKMYELTNGGFDPSIGPLTRLWDISGQKDFNEFPGLVKVPSSEEINNTLELVGFDKVIIDEELKTVYLSKKGMMLDFGGVAKGYASDIIMDYLKTLGYTYISVNLGGNLLVFGESKIYKANGKVVENFIQNPLDPTTTIISTTATNTSIVSSGIYERYIEVNGVKYHHILSPISGYPFDNNLLMVSVIGPNSCTCDGLSTGLFALGLDEGINLIKSLDGYSAFFITKDKKIYVVGDTMFNLTTIGKNNYTLEIVE